MTAQDPNTWEKLYNGVATYEKNQPGGEEVLKKLDELHAMAQHGSAEDFQKHVADLLHTYGANYGLNENTNGQDILREALAWRDTNFPTNELAKQEQESRQPQQSPGAFSGLGKMFGEHKETQIAGRGGDVATPALHEIQEEELLHEFDKAQQTQNSADNPTAREDAIDNVLNQLGAQALFKNQVDLVQNEILNTRAGRNKTREQIVEELTKRASARNERVLANDNDPKNKAQTDRRNERMAQLQQAFDAARKSQDPDSDKKRALLRNAFQNLAQQKIAETTRRYYILEEYADTFQDDVLLDLSRFLRARQVLSRQSRARQQREAENHADEGLYTDKGGSPQQQQQPNGFQKILQKTGKKELGNLAKQGFKDVGKGFTQAGKKAIGAAVKKGFSALVKFLFASPPYIGWWIVGILLALLIIVAVIIIIIAIIQNNQSGSQNTPTPTVGTAVPQGSCSGISCKDKLAALGVFTSGAQGLNGDPYGRVRLLYDTLAKVLQPPSLYGTLLGLPKRTISVDFTNGGCTGHADRNGFLFLNGFGNCGKDVAEFMVIHELSHVIAFRNPSLYNKFLNSVPAFNLPTFNCQLDYIRLGWKPPYPGECFADGIGEYVLYKAYRNTVSGLPHYFTGRPFPNYPTTFSSYYNFAGKYVFNGLTF